MVPGETVKPPRPAQPPDPGLHIYLGGVPADMSSLPSLNGCMRGLKMGETIFGLQKAAKITPGEKGYCGCVAKKMHWFLLE